MPRCRNCGRELPGNPRECPDCGLDQDTVGALPPDVSMLKKVGGCALICIGTFYLAGMAFLLLAVGVASLLGIPLEKATLRYYRLLHRLSASSQL
jgi:hypothetical protein